MYSEEPHDNRRRLSRVKDSVPPEIVSRSQLARPGSPDFSIDDDSIDLSEIWLTFRRYKWTIISFTVVAVVATIIGTSLMRPVYESVTTIQIRPPGNEILEYQNVGVDPANKLSQNNYYETQYQILRSRSLAGDVIDELNLLDNPEIRGEISQPSLMGGVKQLIGMGKGAIAAIVGDAEEARELTPHEVREKAIDRFLKKLVILPVRDSELVNIRFESFDPELAARVSNTLVEKYTQNNMQRYHEAGEQAREFLQAQLTEMQSQLKDADQALQDFAKRQDIADLANRVELSNDKLADLENSLTEIQQEKLAYKVKYDKIKAGKGRLLPEIVNNELINNLQPDLVQQRAEYAKMEGRFKPDYPEMVTLRNRIENLEGQIEEEKENIRESIVDRYESLVDQEQAIKDALQEHESTLLGLNQSSVEYNILKREVESNKELYDGLLQRMKEIGVASGVRENNVAVIDTAEPALMPFKPNMGFNAMMALVLGSVGGTGLAFFLNFLDNTVRRPEDVESLVYLPSLGVIPHIKNDKNKKFASHSSETLAFYSVDRPKTIEAEAYNSLCFNMMYSSSEGMPQTLVVTSPNPMEGKTTTACNLACVLARSGKSTLLVDADFRQPRIHKLFGQPQSPGLTQGIAAYDDLMKGQNNRCLYSSRVKNLYVLTSGSIPRNPADNLAPDRVRGLFDALGKLFDHIIIDSPPVMGMADVLFLSRATDGMLLVVSSGETTKAALKYATQRLRQVHAPLMGVVINNADLERPEYSYYHHGEYNYAIPNEIHALEIFQSRENNRKAG